MIDIKILHFLNILNSWSTIRIGLGISVAFSSFYVCKNDSELTPVKDRFPGRAWAEPVNVVKSLPGIEGLTAKDCGRCHEDHYKEWKTSTHANAFTDLQFQAELSKPNSPQWLCLNCHIPLSGQRREIATHLKGGDVFQPVLVSNKKFDPEWEKEGISCGTCHLKSDSQGNTVLIGPTGAQAPHPVEKNREALHSRCNDCHNQDYKLNLSLVCYFKTGDEYKKSVHFPKEDCVSCHMPSINRSIVLPAFRKEKKDSHRHTFIGGGVPKTFALFDSQWKDYQSGLKIEEPRWSFENKNVRLDVTLENTFAGHSVPTGDPERHLLVEAILQDTNGKEILKKVQRIGQNWEWYPEAKLVNDNRIRSGEKRKMEWNLKIEPDTKPVFGILRILHVRLTKENAEHMRKNAPNTPKEIGDKLGKIELNYPFANVFYESKTDLNTGKIRITSKVKLLEISKRGDL
ncbi:cytochrome C554 and C-prime [Leptospira sp. 201903071]|uniref:multiheme c-type cytochrome n=1 Tax=Leptospira ainazelensis TaxID=2810034 RepID=UPI0019647A84|nr:multiheme c-type cytochrome [Leptospira ainazelensis]MBM9501262.1 cytochrome C554 and C-prime [Leptospira ainazelensis]